NHDNNETQKEIKHCDAIVDEEKDTEGTIPTPIQPTTSVQNHRKGVRRRRKDKHRQSSSIDFTCNEGIKEEDIKVSSIEKGPSKNSSSRSLMSEEEYIEFCFKDNGQIHKIEEKKQIQTKFDNLKEKEESSHLVEESNNESKQEEGALLESRSGSNLSSEGSTTSFSFPILVDSRRSWEGADSPVFMPPLPEDDAIAPPSSNSKDNDSHLH
ncbi:hypothetical protein Leryth_011473, partial [Lithospermum erythrorhizon]